MTSLVVPIKRHPEVPRARVALGEPEREAQIRRGLFTSERGEPFALPFDSMRERESFRGDRLWVTDGARVFRPGVRFEKMAYGRDDLPEHLRGVYDALSRDEMKALYRAHTGHDLHFSIQGNLYGRHFHAGWANPVTGAVEHPLDIRFETLRATHFGKAAHALSGGACRLERCPAEVWPSWSAMAGALSGVMGFTEDLGWLSGGLVTDAFVSEIVDELVSATSSEFADFDHHEVGTDDTAENNDHTALQATSGIARATGTPTDDDPDYINVATVTADATETWEEHGIFNNSSGPAMMDRSLTGGQSVVSSDQVEYTYTLTVNPET